MKKEEKEEKNLFWEWIPDILKANMNFDIG